MHSPSDFPFSAERYDYPDFTGAISSYVICSTPRCGSSLLCDLFQQTNQLGAPQEYLNTDRLAPSLSQRWQITRDGKVSFADYWQMVLRKKTSPNGRFGLKTHYAQLAPFMKNPPISSILGQSKFILMKRRDLIGQAVSYYIAHTTGQWTSLHQQKRAVEYDAQMITKALNDIQHQKGQWDAFFALHGAAHMTICYEDLIDDCAQVMKDVGDFLAVDLDQLPSLERCEINKQSDQRSHDWKARFIEENRCF